MDPINENIRFPEVRVISPDGESLGVMSSRAALSLAQSYNLDLFCIAPQGNPPVCKILDYGKYRFEKQKSDRAAKRGNKGNELRQIQLSPSIGQHDIETKARKARELLEDGSKVQVCVVFRGRQMAHKEIGEAVLQRFWEVLQDIGQVEKPAFWEGKWLKMNIGPKKK